MHDTATNRTTGKEERYGIAKDNWTRKTALTEIENERIELSKNPESVQYEAGMKRLDRWENEILDKQITDNAEAFFTDLDKALEFIPEGGSIPYDITEYEVKEGVQ